MRGGRKVPRGGIVVGAVITFVLIVGCISFVLTQGSAGDEKSESENQVTQSEENVGITEPDSAWSADVLPFSLDGVPKGSDVIDPSAAQTVTLVDAWSFGGDYAAIGSVPINSTTVFGSSTDDPKTVTGYAASLIMADGVTTLEDVQSSEIYYEPQDGTGTAERLVWRSSELSDVPSSDVDNWRVQLWSETTGAVVLGSAEAVNGTSQTPELDTEIVPTANEKAAYFASMVKVDDSWSPKVLSWSLGDDLGTMSVVGEGSYPAAIADGCLYAGDPSYVDTGTVYTSLNLWNGAQSSTVFSLSSDDGSWSISGVWASDAYCVVGFSSAAESADSESYLGVWDSTFEKFYGWVKLSSDRALGGINNDWFVWGAGYVSGKAQMYALRLRDMQVFLLGECEGYSRPSLACDSNTVMIPVPNGNEAVKFSVGSLN